MADEHLGGWAALSRIAARQGGAFATWQANRVGISTGQVNRRIREERWPSPQRSVVVMPGGRDDELERLWVAMLAVADIRAPVDLPDGRDLEALTTALADLIAVAGWSAAAQRGYDRRPPGVQQLLVPHSVTTERDDIRLIRSRRGIAGMWEWLHGLPVTTPFRTMWDVGHLGRGLRGAVDHVEDLATFFDRTRQLPVEDLLRAVEEPVLHGYPRRPPPILQAAAARLSGGYSHSETEATARRIAGEVAAELGVTLHPSPYPIEDAAGVTLAEADIAAPALRFDAEIDGPHHRGPRAAASHARRKARTDRVDWVVCRYPVDEETDTLDEVMFRRRFGDDLRRVIDLRRQAA